MAGEFGSSNYTNQNEYTNSGRQRDNPAQRSNPAAEEFHDYSKQQESSSGTKKTGKSIVRSLSAAAAATVAAVTILPAALGSSADVRFEYLHATDTVLEYVLSIENADEDETLTVLVVTPNGYTVYEQPAEEEIVSGTVSSLQPGGRYEIVVKSGSSTVTSRSVTMAQKRTTELHFVESECKCAIDGTFHFRVDFLDENGYWTDFEATLTDEYGNSSRCDFSDAPTQEHTLSVNDAGMRGNRAILRITCLSSEPDENGSTEQKLFVLFEGEVNI